MSQLYEQYYAAVRALTSSSHQSWVKEIETDLQHM